MGDLMFVCMCISITMFKKNMPSWSLASCNSLYSENNSLINASTDSDHSSQGNDPFMFKKRGCEKKKKNKMHGVEQSSNDKDEVDQSSGKENLSKGLSPNEKNPKEGKTNDCDDDEVEEFDDAQNGEEMVEVSDDQD